MALLPSIAAALVLGLLLTPWIARFAPRLGLVDAPGARKVHATPVPRTGGLGVVVATVAGVVVWAAGHGGLGADAAGFEAWLIPLLLFFALGWWDDRFGIGPGKKLLLQLAVCAVAVALGLRWEGAGIGPFPEMTFGAATPVMTGLWLIAVITVVNWIDGIDLITAATCLVLLAAGAGAGAGPGGGALYAVACAALAGFAFWNISPARVFLGDSGTHALGFLVATLALGDPEHGATALPWALASAPLLPGVIDIGLGLVVKAKRGVPIWAAHRQHLHQRLTRVGWTHPAVALRYGALALVGVVLIGWIGPRFGLLACVGVGALVLGVHLAHALGRTRTVPYEFAAEVRGPS
ncbi:MAG: hypothetical protein QNJ98_04660 [Planctomycetota bacterium]|nr:hypothetical protein [Planctomycetota bacterium]